MCRLQQLDQHCQTSAQQVMELLDRENQLVHERQLLTEEMHILRVQVRPPPAALSERRPGETNGSSDATSPIKSEQDHKCFLVKSSGLYPQCVLISFALGL